MYPLLSGMGHHTPHTHTHSHTHTHTHTHTNIPNTHRCHDAAHRGGACCTYTHEKAGIGRRFFYMVNQMNFPLTSTGLNYTENIYNNGIYQR